MSAQFESVESCKHIIQRDMEKFMEAMNPIDTFEELAASMRLLIEHSAVLLGYISSMTEDPEEFIRLCSDINGND